jgi:hypothetical protein
MHADNFKMKFDSHCLDMSPWSIARYQRIGAHGEMISSDLHGAEEPNGRWDGRCRTGFMMSPFIRTFGVDISPWQVDVYVTRFPETTGWFRVDDAGGPGGATFHSFGGYHAL